MRTNLKRKQEYNDKLFEVANLIERDGFETLEALSCRELKKILIYRNWVGTGGKLGYRPLAKKYGLTVSKVRTICSKFKGVDY